MRTITNNQIDELIQKASLTKRKRTHMLLHESHQEPVHRMINAMVPGSYVPPHKHENPDKVELFCILKGKVASIKFSPKGNIDEVYSLSETGPVRVIDIRPKIFHTFIALKPSAMLEIIQGPYTKNTHKNLASWAPPEDSTEAAHYAKKLEFQVLQLLNSKQSK